MSARIEQGSIVLSPAEVRILYQVAKIGELRTHYRVGNTTVYRLLTEISVAAFTAPAVDGNLTRQDTASEERDWWTVAQLARATRLAQRTVRLDCQTGTLPARKNGRGWLIRTTDAHTYLAARQAA